MDYTYTLQRLEREFFNFEQENLATIETIQKLLIALEKYRKCKKLNKTQLKQIYEDSGIHCYFINDYSYKLCIRIECKEKQYGRDELNHRYETVNIFLRDDDYCDVNHLYLRIEKDLGKYLNSKLDSQKEIQKYVEFYPHLQKLLEQFPIGERAIQELTRR